MLTYVGRTPAPEIRFLALEVVAAALDLPGAQLVRNPEARNALSAAGPLGVEAGARRPAVAAAAVARLSAWTGPGPRAEAGDVRRQAVRAAGRTPGVSMRPHGCRRPLFTAVHDYIAASKVTIRPGDHLDAGAAHLVARAPRPEEHWLATAGELLVLEDRTA